MGGFEIAVNSFLVVDMFELPILLLLGIALLFFMIPPRSPIAILSVPLLLLGCDTSRSRSLSNILLGMVLGMCGSLGPLNGPFTPVAAEMAGACALTPDTGSWTTFLAPKVSVGIDNGDF